MPQQVQEIMTKKLHTVPNDATLRDVARVMQTEKIGTVIVNNSDGKMRGIVTDRDLVVRGLAAQRDLDATKIADICTDSVAKLEPTATLDDAVELMRKNAVRRIPVVRDGAAIGIVTIGDLARAKDPKSALAQISVAAPNN